MKYKTVVSDLDGTLLNSEGKISRYSKEIIKKIVEKGINFFIATGRHYNDAKKVREYLDLDTFLISSNGARVHNGKGEMVIKHDLKKGLVSKTLDMFKDLKGIQISMYTQDKWFLNQSSKTIDKFSRSSGFPYEIKSIEEMKKYNAVKLFFMSDEHDNLVKIEKKLLEKYEEKVNIMFSLPICLEITPHGVSKGTAIKEIFKKINLKTEETIAFGDGFNDYEMLKIVGKGLVMGNSHYKLKNELINHEIIKTNDENGLAKYLEDFFL